MILWLHRLRQDEEGQTLVLGAVFGIILALCVLGTVNMGRAVYEKIQLQTACDDGAYSQAAVEARVLNLTAYTNRAMVVQYASIMAAQSYQSWLHFVAGLMQVIGLLADFIPYVDVIVQVVNEIIQVLLVVLDIAVALLTPIVSAANVVLYALQEGAWASLYGSRLTMIPPEAHSGDSNADAYRPIWPNLVPYANMAVFSQARGHALLPLAIVDSVNVMLNNSSPAVQEARLHMIEIANSARAPWVAYGDRYSNPSASPLARHWRWSANLGICSGWLGVNARTELGSRAPSNGGGLAMFGQSYSGSRLHLKFKCFLLPGTDADLFTLSTLDQIDPANPSTYQSGKAKGKDPISLILKTAGSLAAKYAQQEVPIRPDYRAAWISPYVYFTPSTKTGPSGGLLSNTLGNFGQPDVIFGVARQRADFNRTPAVFGGKINGIVGNLGGEVDFTYNGNDWPTIPGLPAPLQLHEGFNALCAAQTYYHRPGDWKEMPNFFNPLWAARLMPVMDANAGAALGTSVVPLLKTLLLH